VVKRNKKVAFYFLIASAVLLTQTPTASLGQAGGDRVVGVAVIANSCDAQAAEAMADSLRSAGFDVVVLSADRADEVGDRFPLILGGPDAYEGVGEISASVLNDTDEAWLREVQGALIVYLGYWGNRTAVVIAGQTRNETLLAARLYASSGFPGSPMSTRLTSLESRGVLPGQYANYSTMILSPYGDNVTGFMLYTVSSGTLGGVQATVIVQSAVNVYAPQSNATSVAYYLENGSICTYASISGAGMGSFTSNLTCTAWEPPNLTGQEVPRVLGRATAEYREVPAGTFYCAKFARQTGAVWVSPEVPITGIVEVVDYQPGGPLSVMSLVGFSWG